MVAEFRLATFFRRITFRPVSPSFFPRCLLWLFILALSALASRAEESSSAAPASSNLGKLTARIARCEAIFREFQVDPQLAIPEAVLREARGVVMVSQVRGGLVVGLQYGYGAVLARRPDGRWSAPVFLRAGEASIGLQLGGKRTETIYMLMNDEAVRLLFQDRTNIGVDVLAIVGPRSYEAGLVNRDILTTPVLVYGRDHGLFAGATVKTGWWERNDAANRDFYGTPHTLPEILFGDVVSSPAAARSLTDFLTQIAP